MCSSDLIPCALPICGPSDLPLIGAVPDDEEVVISTNQGEPLAGKPGLCGQAYLNICHRLLGEEVPFQDLDVKKGILGRLFGR